ncbi:MAG TPA: Smr/MutS family protein [Burkholderiales bacterium]|nr:Smr/MutS family protein [Burkholderiales bacterium]
MRKRANDGSREDDATLFRDAVRDATPLEPSERLWRKGKSVPPVPVQSLLDVHDALAESLTGPISLDQSIETGEELFYLRDGLGRNVLHKLRRGHWVVQDAVDLHGSNRDEARSLLAEFLGGCLKRGLRCVRVIHGKGLRSPKREPVLKGKVRQWLAQRDEVLAFCQAPTNQGGSGALLVLLRA